jgi:hypothetical protein
MAAPVVIPFLVASDKTTGTTINCSAPAFFGVGDLLVVHISMDPAAGAVSFGALSGVATFGAYTLTDVVNGSGTSGVRTVVAWARCTGPSTTASGGLTVTHPSLNARAVWAFAVLGTDPDIDPVIGSGHAASGTAYTTLTPPVTGIGTAVAALSLMGLEAANGTAVSAGAGFNQATGGDFTAVDDNTVTSGTSGAGSASNISIGYLSEMRDEAPNEAVSVFSRVAESNACVGMIFAGLPPQPDVVMTSTRTGA